MTREELAAERERAGYPPYAEHRPWKWTPPAICITPGCNVTAGRQGARCGICGVEHREQAALARKRKPKSRAWKREWYARTKGKEAGPAQ